MSVFDCVDYLKGKGFHDNSFIIGPLYRPEHYNLLNLPEWMVQRVKRTLRQRLNNGAEGYLKNSYENLLAYFSSTIWHKDIKKFFEKTKIQDARRNVDSENIFKKLFDELNAETLR
jgi:hypothetical protein